MDNPPSFSLGITQLDATVQDIPVGFVPATFDEQDPDRAENRSKHRNDPMENFDNAEDALNLAILFFVHTFMFSQHKEAPISVAHFQIVEDGRYINFLCILTRIYNLQPMKLAGWICPFQKILRHVIQQLMLRHPTGKLKRTSAELQQRVGTIAEEFGDFSTIPPREILKKTGFKSPVSPDQPLKKRKTVMFEQDHQVMMDNDTCGRGHAVYHGSDLYHETQKDAVDKEEIGVSEIQHHHHEEIGVSPQSHQHKSVPSSSKQHEGTSKSSLDDDKIKNYINKCFTEKMAELVTLISKIPVEVVKALKNEENKQSQEDKIDEQQQSQEDGSNKHERPHNEDMQNENYAKGSINDMEVSRDEKSNKHHILEEQQLLNVNAVNKDAGREDDFENEDCSDLEALEDEVGGTITNSIQATVDTILFGLSTPSTTKSMDVGASSKMTERHWDLSDSQIPPDFPDAQVQELQASKANVPVKREKKKSRILRKETKNHYRVNASGLGYSQLNFVVAYPQFKNWFYLMFERKTCWNDEVLVVIVLKERLIRVYDSLSSKRKKEPPIEIQKLAVMLPTYLSENDFYDKTERTDWPSFEAYKGKITQQTVLDCDVFVCVYAEILSEGLQVHSRGFDAARQRARYASLPWHYGVKKANEGYTSDNGDPPRPKKSVIEEIKASATVTLE
ncbi:hypothetical protein FXO38_31225 [Capsicum annuum]|nr:hypothetical protein FXO38_31225 [Capsicum annuum]KAF3625277.1 hypothetical protein FXO37_30945 [Capsicum annuum]